MNRILKRPMFRMGGSSGTGITSGLDKPRVKYSEGTTRERLLSAIGQAPSPLPQFLTQFGLNLLSQSPRGNIFATAATAAQKPTQDLFKDIEKQRALEAQVGLTAEKLDIAQEQALALKRAERLGTKILTKDEVKKNWLNLLSVLKNKLLSMPNKVAPVVLTYKNVNEVKLILKDKIYDTLHEIAGTDLTKNDKRNVRSNKVKSKPIKTASQSNSK